MDQHPGLHEPGAAPLRVVVVEDTVVVADEIVKMVTSLGCEVAAAVGTVGEALKLVTVSPGGTQAEFDLALLDVNLNNEPVFPVADVLLKRAIPMVFLTGYARDSLPAGFRHMPCLEKPFSRRQLAETLEAVLGHALGR